MYESGSGFSGCTQIVCRQPKNKIIQNRDLDSLYIGRKDKRWHRLVTTFDSDLSMFSVAKVADVLQQDLQLLYQMELRNGSTVKCLPTQQFLTREGYKPLWDIEVGECVGVMRSKLVWFSVVESIKQLDQEEKVYSITLEDDADSIITNGIVSKL